MFHKRYQKLTETGFREKQRLIAAEEALESGLAMKAQTACDRYTQRAFLALRSEPERLVWERLHPESYDRKQVEKAVEALKVANQTQPMAVYAVKLSEYYMYLEKYVEAVETLKGAIASEPDDLRLTYALATLYRILARARPDEAKRMYAPGVLERGVFVASPEIEDACARLGLTAEDARRLAVEHFSRALTMNIHPDERQAVQGSLQIMQEMLKGRVRAVWEM